MSFTDRIQAVTDDLAAYGITFVFDTSASTTGDAWVDAAAKHGRRLAFIHEENGSWVEGGVRFRTWNGDTLVRNTIWVSFDHSHPDDAIKIVHVFTEHGFGADWDDDPHTAVEVFLS